ncbi:lysine-specific histone demethylase 1 homolog 2 [Eucalyptus grandis]|uniref:lysine-specific histone demethylase 1 homolog 2 n=1 Tax=Eucalyptus grandis TaxID=71139 RepID=UPI00192EA90F|nr:lysine-specific histone demethylase 1 homolog 2 [Eucalyptus grandis]XP_039171909.1 lysine-specific histone demethylase 1 homolog 2 [Eucalyptus grandis]
MDGLLSGGLVPKRSLRKKAAMKNYNENLIDEVIDSHLGGASRKRNRTTQDLEKETETEAMMAISLGFPIDALLEEEIRAGVVRQLGGKEQNDYIVVRNHILAKWRNNVRMWLTKDRIRETVSSECEHLICSAYDFLLNNGYINYGILPTMPEEVVEGSVIIVGAGLAGLAAARQLLSFGFKVLVLEGRNRPGGRVYTQKMSQNGDFAAVDLGGSVITGIHANPLGVLARQLSIPLHKVREKCPLYRPDGTPVNEKTDSEVEFIFNRLLDKVMELRQIKHGFGHDISLGTVLETLRQLYGVAKSKEEMQLLDWHFANLEYANAGCLSNLSAAYWDQDDPYEMSGDHCFLAGGNGRLVKALSDGVPIFYNKIVNMIRYNDDGVEVIAGNQVFQADAVLCTVPLGVLKKRTITFEPELPPRKLEAIERLGFGLLNKVAMVFPYVFWGEDLDTFGCLSEEGQNRGEFFLFYSYHTVSGGPVLIALVAGEAAQAFEYMDPCTSLSRVLSILKGIYRPKGIDVPHPIQSICTRWGSDPLSYGSYSHVRVNSSGRDYDILGESVGNRLFFAGEATSRQYPASMHGAFLSGLKEASHISHAARDWETTSRKFVQRNIGASSDLLVDLFLKPDLAFGNFMVIFDPLNDDPKSMAILRVNFDNNKISLPGNLNSFHEHSANGPSPLYTVLTCEQAQDLHLMSGGDDSRLSYLTKTLCLKLMGLSAAVNFASYLISNIASARRIMGKGRLSCGYKNNVHT